MTSNSIYQLCHIRLSACISADRTGRISIKFDRWGAFIKIGLQMPNLVKIGQKHRAFYFNTSVPFTVGGDNKSL
jgi:hypothetical protein